MELAKADFQARQLSSKVSNDRFEPRLCGNSKRYLRQVGVLGFVAERNSNGISDGPRRLVGASEGPGAGVFVQIRPRSPFYEAIALISPCTPIREIMRLML